MFGTILLAVDGSEHAHKVLRLSKRPVLIAR
jgi:hypothetical protein